jgi:hypothetical protein
VIVRVEAFHNRNVLPSEELQKNSTMEAGFLDSQQQISLKNEMMENFVIPPFLNESLTLRDYQLGGIRWLIWYISTSLVIL